MPALLIKPLLWAAAGVLGWQWLTSSGDEPETGTERTYGRLIWAAAGVLGAVWAVKAWKRG